MHDYTSFHNSVIPAIIGFVISLTWLSSKLIDYSYFSNLFSKIDDRKKIILPSISIIVFPFIFVQIWHQILYGYDRLLDLDEQKIKVLSSLLSSTMPFIAILIFIVGQSILKQQEQIQKEQEANFAFEFTLDYFFFLFSVGNPSQSQVGNIEYYQRLLLKHSCHENCYKIYIDRMVENTRISRIQLTQQSYLFALNHNIQKMNYSVKYISFLRKIELYLEKIICFDWYTSMLDGNSIEIGKNLKFNHILEYLIEFIELKLEGLELIINLYDNDVKNQDKIKVIKEYLNNYKESVYWFIVGLKTDDKYKIDNVPTFMDKVLLPEAPSKEIGKLDPLITKIDTIMELANERLK